MYKDSKWIWTNDSSFDVNHWINVRRKFNLNSVHADAKISISADTDYVVLINGKFVNTGQYSDFAKQKHYDKLEIGKLLREGQNVLAILGYYQGQSTSRYQKGKPGLIFTLTNGTDLIISDSNCKARTSPAYTNGPVPLVTMQLGLTIAYNAEKDDDWTGPDYIDSGWKSAKEIAPITAGCWETLNPRPIPKLVLSTYNAIIADYGKIRAFTQALVFADEMASAKLESDSDKKYVDTQTATLSLIGKSAGCYIRYDLGSEQFGYLQLELDAPAGTIIDIAHGQHIEDGRVRCKIAQRNFADRYICKQGRQNWLMPVRRLGCRYIELHIKKMSAPVTIHHVGLLTAEYPVEISGLFECDEKIHGKITDVAIRTAKLCMHDHYEDTPWREQSLYAMDSRNQALCGYYLFGEYKFPEESLRLLGNSVSDDGFISLCAPSDLTFTIPCFSMVWISAIRDFMLFSGKKEIVQEFMPQIKRMLTSYLELCDTTGLMTTPKGKRYWNFYDWSPGLQGENIDIGAFNSMLAHHSCLNLFLIEALDAASQLCQWLEDSDEALFQQESHNLRRAIFKEFSKDNSVLIPNSLQGELAENYSQLTQAMTICRNVLPPQKASALRSEMLKNKKLIPATLAMQSYLFEALLQDPDNFGTDVLDYICKNWGHMLASGCTAFWETIKGAADFDGAGSLCHGWSITPVYVYFAHILGIKPIEPGFHKFSINPQRCGLEKAQGIVPTPCGNIEVKWQKFENGYQLMVDYPEKLHPEITIPASQQNQWNIHLSAIKTLSPKTKNDFKLPIK